MYILYVGAEKDLLYFFVSLSRGCLEPHPLFGLYAAVHQSLADDDDGAWCRGGDAATVEGEVVDGLHEGCGGWVEDGEWCAAIVAEINVADIDCRGTECPEPDNVDVGWVGKGAVGLLHVVQIHDCLLGRAHVEHVRSGPIAGVVEHAEGWTASG